MQNYDWCDEYIKKAQYMMEKNSYEKALDYLKEAEKLDGLNHEIYEKKGICYYSKVLFL
jgi:tetratricopeptide (TPR) repeat protein